MKRTLTEVTYTIQVKTGLWLRDFSLINGETVSSIKLTKVESQAIVINGYSDANRLMKYVEGNIFRKTIETVVTETIEEIKEDY